MATLESHNDRHASPRTHDRPVRRSNRVTTSPIVPAGTDDKDAEADEQHCLVRFRSVEIGVHRSLAAATDISVVAEVLGTIAGALGGVHAELWLANDRSDSVLHPIATWTDAGHDGRIRTPNVLSCGVGLAGTACRTGEPVWSADLGLDKPLLSPGTVSTGRLAAAVAVPVRGGRHAIGALVVLAGAPWPYDASAVDLLTGAAAHMGEFLQRRRAEALVRELDRAKDEYIALVGHELRTPLTSIVSFTDLIADLPDDTTLGECRDLLNVVRQHGNGLRGIVEDLLDLGRRRRDRPDRGRAGRRAARRAVRAADHPGRERPAPPARREPDRQRRQVQPGRRARHGHAHRRRRLRRPHGHRHRHRHPRRRA
jgi:signal transduction histidine kinase